MLLAWCQDSGSEQATPRLSTALRRVSGALQQAAGSRARHGQHHTRSADGELHGSGTGQEQEEEEELLGGELLVRVESAHVRCRASLP